MKIAIDIINEVMNTGRKACIAFSGGSDSIVLIDLIYRHTNWRPLVIFADSQMEYPETENFCQDVCKTYGIELHVARSLRTPTQQWQKQGWPMMGKMAARIWMQRHRQRPMGFKLDVSSCCRNMKIAPARKLARQLGCEIQFTGTKGASDDLLRSMRAFKDGAIKYVKSDRLTICSPLTGWTDTMVRRYFDKNDLMEHPAKSRGAITIGCVCCGGGSQFSNSGFRVLRKTWPEAWWKYVVQAGMGEIILAIKYDKPLDEIREAIEAIGGIALLAETRPWIFDFTTKSPIQGYLK